MKSVFWIILVACFICFFMINSFADDNTALKEKCWDIIKNALKSKDVDARRTAAIIIYDLEPDECIPVICQALDDKNEWVVNGALFACGKIKNADITPVIKKALAMDQKIKEGAIQVIGESGRKCDLPVLKEYFDGKDGFLKFYAAASMAMLDDKSGLPYIKSVAVGNDIDMKREAIFFLGKLKDRDSLPLLKEALKDPDTETQRRAILALGFFDDADLVPLLLEYLKSSDDQIRGAAVMSLGKRKDEIIKNEISKLVDDPDWRIRNDAVDVISGWGDEALPILRHAMDDKNLVVRIKAAAALAKRDDKDALAVILKDLKDPNELVRKFSARVVGDSGDAGCIPQLEPLLDDNSELVRPEAARSIIKLLNTSKSQ